jgi:hypothetical protein
MGMATMKIDYKRELRELYTAGPRPALIDVPSRSYAMIDGHGDPNAAAEYTEAVETLYAFSYAAKFAVKHRSGVDYVVMPLEGLWWVPDMSAFTTTDKSAWDWTMMIVQPAEVTAEIVDQALTKAAAKKGADVAARLRVERFDEGLSAQVMHRGPYSAEGSTIAALHDFIAGAGYELAGKHHEIYLSDPRRTAPEKLKTILRQPVGAGSA